MRSPFYRMAVAVFSIGLLAATPAVSVAAPRTSSGVNDWSCRPSAAHPDPVVLLHSLGFNDAASFAYLAPKIADEGYCVFSLTYGRPAPEVPNGGLGPIAASAAEIEGFVGRVLAATGAAKVDLVGHSEGAALSLYLPKVDHFADRVAKVVALGPGTHGATYGGLLDVAEFFGQRDALEDALNRFGCTACNDLMPGSAFIEALNAGPIAQPGVDYTVIATRFDLLVAPTSSSFVEEDGVDNQYVQDTCPLDPVGHFGLPLDRGVAQMVLNALDPAHAVQVSCSIGLPV